MEAIKKILDKILAAICIGLFGFLVLLVTWQVFTRFILNNPSVISEELAKYCFTWLVLFGAAFVFGERGHMAVEFIKDRFPQKLRLVAEVSIEVITILFAIAVLLIGGYFAAEIAWNQLSASLQIPVGYLYAGIPISGLFIVFYCIYNITHILKNNKSIEQL